MCDGIFIYGNKIYETVIIPSVGGSSVEVSRAGYNVFFFGDGDLLQAGWNFGALICDMLYLMDGEWIDIFACLVGDGIGILNAGFSSIGIREPFIAWSFYVGAHICDGLWFIIYGLTIPIIGLSVQYVEIIGINTISLNNQIINRDYLVLYTV